ncbi:GNAT family N-acetyltransferase [Cellulosimicrobium arenosum]|uniref:N-acetyltransferase n=1 Tax=Cellulosimicrobium arenosum TaxID=2708133 RepID=A0A927J1Q6_9MICO|nr:GNAT family N-acetyltransferase [Cellulosimicrobium arenosum]MBD8080306.1 N-acetyltransferase [Cellulosimicrobium arenosum]
MSERTSSDGADGGGDLRFVDAGDRFEVRASDGVVAGFAAYQRYGEDPGTLVFTHTEVDPAYEGKGVGSALVSQALDQARQAGEGVVAMCPFVQAYLRRHPEYEDLVHRD